MKAITVDNWQNTIIRTSYFLIFPLKFTMCWEKGKIYFIALFFTYTFCLWTVLFHRRRFQGPWRRCMAFHPWNSKPHKLSRLNSLAPNRELDQWEKWPMPYIVCFLDMSCLKIHIYAMTLPCNMNKPTWFYFRLLFIKRARHFFHKKNRSAMRIHYFFCIINNFIVYSVKKAFRYSRTQPGSRLPNFPWAGIMTSYINEFGKWHPGWGREYRKAFLRCIGSNAVLSSAVMAMTRASQREGSPIYVLHLL